MIIVSFGAGTNSTAMLVGMHERGINPDAILFADTGAERPYTYCHLRDVNKWLGKVGFPIITTVKSPNVTLEADCLKRAALPSLAYGFKTCSQRFKAEPQEKWVRNWPPALGVWATGHRITKAIGIDADEQHRAKKYDTEKFNTWYPLMDWDWGRDECVAAIERGGLSQPGKSSCYFCPSMRPHEVRQLKEQYPELAKRALAMEANADLTNIKGLGRNWAWRDLLATDDMFAAEYHSIELACGCYDGS